MSDKKMIIKNCPSCTKQDVCIAMYLRAPVDCKERNDCVLKQIVEKCKGVQEKFYDAVHSRYLSPSKAKFAREILDLLQIQEVE